jgi:hypothetical protein
VIPDLPLYLPQVRYLTALAGHLREPIYALRAKEIVRKTHVKTAAQVREALGLDNKQLLVVLLFDDDDVLKIFYERPQKIRQLAEGGFDLIVTASFSVWSPRPRMHVLRNMMLSLQLFVTLQEFGATAIPRFDWQIEHDVHRWAQWLDLNPGVALVGFDAMTCATNGWDEVLEGLEILDTETGKRLRYCINGPSVANRWSDLMSVIPADRICLTEARPIAAAPSTQEKLSFRGSFAEVLGPRFNSRVSERQKALRHLAEAA